MLAQTVHPESGCERRDIRIAAVSVLVLFVVALIEETSIIAVALRGESGVEFQTLLLFADLELYDIERAIHCALCARLNPSLAPHFITEV